MSVDDGRGPEMFRRKQYLPEIAARRGVAGEWEGDVSVSSVSVRATTDDRSGSAYVELQGYAPEGGAPSCDFGIDAEEAERLSEFFAELASVLGSESEA